MKWRDLAIFPGIMLILPLLFAGCATKIKTTMLAPAKSHEVANVKRIAVLPFSGRGGDEVSADVGLTGRYHRKWQSLLQCH